MYTIYRVKSDELDERFLESIKVLFRGREIEIAVYEHDETDYLLSSPVNRDRLLRAIHDVENGRNVIVPDQEQFQ